MAESVVLHEVLPSTSHFTYVVKDDYFRATKNKNEVKFENNNKDDVSSIFMMIFNTWKQHIYYLNNVENRYLAELRDALLPDLMSGKIEIPE